MKKKNLSQLMILSFAFAGLFFVGNNVFADNEPIGGDPGVLMPPDDQGDGGSGDDCQMSVTCGANICIVLNAKSRFFSTDCKKECDYTCTQIKIW